MRLIPSEMQVPIWSLKKKFLNVRAKGEKV